MEDTIHLIEICLTLNNMKNANDKYFEEFEKIIQQAVEIAQRENGQIVDLSTRDIFTTGGPALHQDTKTATEEENAAFERENPLLFAFMRSIDEEMRGLF